MDAGQEDQLRELRQTDVDEAKCRARYTVFKEHYGTLLRLKQHFPFRWAIIPCIYTYTIR